MKRRVLAIGGATMALAAGVGGGVAYAANDSTPGTATAAGPAGTATLTTADTTATAAPKKKARPILRRALHGEFTVKSKDGFRTVQAQRGTISAVSASRITIVSADHYSHTYVLGDKTRIRIDKQRSTAGNLVKGAHASVVTGPRLGADTAARVIERTK